MLITRIERFLRETGMPWTKFGQLAPTTRALSRICATAAYLAMQPRNVWNIS